MFLRHSDFLCTLCCIFSATPTSTSAHPAQGAGSALQAAGPTLDLPPSDSSPSSEADHVDPLRGMQEHRFRTAASTSIGGYGELHYNRVEQEGEGRGTVDFHRLVVFIAHNFSTDLRFYSEIELEHAFSGDGKPGEVGVEQAFAEYRLLGERLSMRAGVLLVPLGIINQWHEPPIFNGVERPLVDKVIIPSTWREAGLGFAGTPVEGLNYEIYLLSGLNALGFKASDSIRGGRQQIAKARANDFAVAGRLEYEPLLGVVVGGSAYYGESGGNAGELFDPAGAPINLTVPVFGLAADARARFKGLEARAVVATFTIGNTAKLRKVTNADGESIGRDVGSRTRGYYVEAGYDVLSLLGADHQLVPFVRYELADPMSNVKGRTRTDEDDAREIRDIVFGLSYRPVAQVAFKGDVILRDPVGSDNNSTLINLGVGFMF